RIPMTVVRRGSMSGQLQTLLSERAGADGETPIETPSGRGTTHANLSKDDNVLRPVQLQADTGICYRGAQTIGKGFIVSHEKALDLGRGDPAAERVLRPYRNGRDIVDQPRDVYAIDFFGLTEAEARRLHPAAYQWVLERVKPE